jgi:hypothetical protein
LSGLSGPYYLDFQLIGTNNNEVTVGNFNFGSGGSIPPAHVFPGSDATGNLGSSVTLDDFSVWYNELYEQFTPGGPLSFTVDLKTSNIGSTPDMFSFAILDSGLNELPTTDPNYGASFLDIQFDSTTNPTVLTYGSSSASTLNLQPPTANPVSTLPEPAVIWQLGGMWTLLAGLGAARRIRTM